MDTMKEMFQDVLQQVIESELEAELVYEKASVCCGKGCRKSAPELSQRILEKDKCVERPQKQGSFGRIPALCG